MNGRACKELSLGNMDVMRMVSNGLSNETIRSNNLYTKLMMLKVRQSVSGL